jgi:hypothetical protein
MNTPVNDAVYTAVTLIEHRLRREFARPRQYGAA